MLILSNFIVASQIWLLGRILPLVIGEHVPDDDEHWILFLCLMDIVDLVFAPTTTEDHAIYISSLINDHHREFVHLYPDASVLPKFHFMVHLGRLLINNYAYNETFLSRLVFYFYTDLAHLYVTGP